MAAPKGWAGSVAASTIGGVGRRRVALGPQPVDGAGHGELGGAEAGHEVAAPHLAPLLQRLEHRVDAGEAALGPLAQRRLAGEHAVALEQLQGPGVGRLGGAWARGASSGATSDQRPAPAGGPMPGQPPGPGPTRERRDRPGATRPAGRRRRRRPAAGPASRW